ncbi:MAG: peptidoglycan recognition protein family protein [Lachnospiraceae bacterium]|nr:peptidoglycan recognition protein family protein [Lachnospiraceae bacterium]
MGNQARQSQELELWHVVSSSGNVRSRQARARRTDAQTRSDMQRRGSASNYNRTRAENARPAGTVRRRNAGSVRTPNPRTVRTGNARTAYPRSAGAVRADYARTANPRTVRAASARPARTVRPANSNTRAKVQAAKKKKTGSRSLVNQFFAFVWIVAMCAAVVFMGKAFYESTQASPVVKAEKPVETNVSEGIPVVEDIKRKPNIREDFLTISEYNRPGTKLACVKNIFVHYTANPKTSAAQNRSYFENLGQTHERAASAHFIIGYEGEIIQCIPLEEEAYAVVERNGDSISIECCYLAADGSFTKETYNSLVEMLAWLIDKYDLEPKDILRHYDCGGKLCPIYYVKHEDAWQQLLDDVAHYTY